MMTGSSVSWTTTIWIALVVFPWPSVAVQVTRLVPTGKTDGASFVTVTPPQLSLKMGSPKSTFVAEQRPGSAVTSKSDGETRKGGVTSSTTMVLARTTALPEVSNAVRTT